MSSLGQPHCGASRILAEAAGSSGMLAGQMADLQAERRTETYVEGWQGNSGVRHQRVHSRLWRPSTAVKLGQCFALPFGWGR